MTTLNIRIENNVKSKASKTLASLGLDMSTAVKMFLNQVVVEQGLPFTPTRNPIMIKAKWDREVKEALKSGKSFTNAEELFKSIR